MIQLIEINLNCVCSEKQDTLTCKKILYPETNGDWVLFDDDMTMVVDGAGAAAAVIPYEYDTWYFCEVIVDLDNDNCEFYVDGNLEHEYQWTLGTFGTPGALTLAGSNIYAAPGTGLTPPGAFFDDICFEELPPIVIPGPLNVTAMVENDVDVHVDWEEPNTDLVLEGYNVLRNGTLLGYVAVPTTEYDDMGLAHGVYEYCVTAVYDEAESQPVCAPAVTIIDMSPPAPPNLEGMVGGNGVDLAWEGPEGGWIRWDAGVNTGNGIGVTGGGTFNVASHWEPADLEDYVGFSLTKVQFYANGDPDATYTIKVWTGVNGTNVVHTQPVASFIVDDWNEVELTTSVPINAADDFWFGYAVTHGADMFPAGCDDGPAIQYKGDMLNSGAGWVSISAEYGLDYNWNLAGFVELTDGSTAPLTPKEDIIPYFTGTFASSLESGMPVQPSNKFNPTFAKDLTYNVYFKPEGGSYSEIANTAVTNYTHTSPVIGWNYYYVTTLVNGAESDPSNEVSILFTSIEDIVSFSTQVYPNPASNFVNIKSDFEISSITVYNYAGQVITKEQVDNYTHQFNTSEFNSGIYFFQIETTDGTTSKRIIVE
ncbi:MAG: T9SS type A sorting domain-containing protein [Bacteroidales bacterium]